MSRKRKSPVDKKKDKYDEMDDFIEDNSDEDYSPDFSFDETVTQLTKYEKNQLKELEKMKKDNQINLQKILNSNFNQEDKLWFIDYLKIAENLEEYTEERFKIENTIKEKFNKLCESEKHNKIIQNIKKIGNIETSIIDRIVNSKHDDYIKSLIYKRYEKYQKDTNLINSDEYYKDIKWIETVLEIPTEIKNSNCSNITLSEQLILLKESLDNSVFGLDKVKEAIIETFCAIYANSDYQKKFITLVGPPGVGKTVISKAIANALNIPYGQIDFCTLKDSNLLVGHSQTYIGATSGMFVNILKESKYLNPLILLDEIDKVSNETSTIQSVLLQVLDKTRNSKFTDAFMPEVKIDLSKVFFIVALNDETKINSILKDRLNIIRINGYSKKEKNIIGREYILPNIIKQLGFTEGQIYFKESTMDYLIEKCSNEESGVRELEKSITNICEKINVLKNIQKAKKKIKLTYSIPNLKFPFEVTNNTIDLFI